ncbi:unnamed protein product [Ectocarpus sp. 12 AP-2014]
MIEDPVVLQVPFRTRTPALLAACSRETGGVGTAVRTREVRVFEAVYLYTGANFVTGTPHHVAYRTPSIMSFISLFQPHTQGEMTITQYSRGVPQNLPRPVPHSLSPWCKPAQLRVTRALRRRFCAGLRRVVHPVGGGKARSAARKNKTKKRVLLLCHKERCLLF